MLNAAQNGGEEVRLEGHDSEKRILFEVYQIIQEIRVKITGQSLKYRIYVIDNTVTNKGKKKQEMKIIELEEADLEEFISFGNSTEFTFLTSKLKTAIANEQLESAANKYNVQKVTKEFEKALKFLKRGELGIQRYYKYTKNKKGEIKKEEISYNLGHIVEALERMRVEEISLRKKSFYQNLFRDKVPGFYSGDVQEVEKEIPKVTQIQVKLQNARLARYKTIILAMDKFIQLGEDMLNPKNKEAIREQLKEMYAPKKGQVEDASSTITQTAIDNFIDSFYDSVNK